MFTFVIADLHGSDELLDQAHRAISNRADHGTIVYLGDYIDRGPNSRAVLDKVAQPLENFKKKFLMGNHEALMLGTLEDRNEECELTWLTNGGLETLRNYTYEDGSIDTVGLKEHIAFLENLKLYYEDDHRLYVHGYVEDGIPVHQQDVPNIYFTKLLWGRYQNFDEGFYFNKHVVHGHTPKVNGPELKAGRTNLDTGAVFGGSLTVGVFDDDKPGGPVDLIRIFPSKGKH